MSRRRFIVGCALCSLGGFISASASAQSNAPTATPGVRRKILQQTDGPSPGYVTVIAEAEVDAGGLVARRTHPGIESGFMIEGSGELKVDGQPDRRLNAGDAYQIPVAIPHSFENGGKTAKHVATYIVEKGKPLASPA
jgi:quercetin dioxygenase-like cupin family protein